MMAGALLDTNAVSDLMRDHPRVKARAANYSDPVVTSVIVVGEIRYGLDRLPAGKKRKDLEARTANILAVLPAEPTTSQVTEAYAHLKPSLEAPGLNPDDKDLMLAPAA